MNIYLFLNLAIYYKNNMLKAVYFKSFYVLLLILNIFISHNFLYIFIINYFLKIIYFNLFFYFYLIFYLYIQKK